MSSQHRSFLRVSLISGLLLASAFGGAAAAQQARWSDPATWPDGKVPAAGDKVVIEAGKEVVLDVSPPALNGLTVNGKLSFANSADLELTTEWVMLHGELAIGTEAKPHTRKATITLTDNVRGENVMGDMGDRGIMIAGGTLNLHGDRKNAWTKLSKTAQAGATSIEVLNAQSWRVGDEIVLASTDFDPRQAERRTITAISGNKVTLAKPLDYMHFGEVTFGVDERGEVGLLTRNIRIQASADAEKTYFGGHVMAMTTSKMFVEGVEFQRMGQHLTLARYPIHWHLIGDAKGQYIRNSAIHDTYNRCVTVHGTHNMRVENNVTYNTVGHCFFLEDGIETGNQYVKNLGIQTKCHPTLPCIPTNLFRDGPRSTGQTSKDVLIPSDNTAATFWITNPDNTYRDNVAAGSDQIGFWIALPQHPTGAFEGTEESKATWPRRTPLREFKGNVSHSNFDGLMFDRGPGPDGRFTVGGAGHTARADPANADSAPVEAVIEDFTGYKNRNGAIWGRGELHMFKNLKLADNAIGFTHASGEFGRRAYTSRVVDSLFVGETANIGNPGTAAEKAYGRSLPKDDTPDFPIRGYEYYDYRHDVQNVTFRNYEDNATRKAGALSYLMYTSFGMSTANTVERIKFINAKPVHFPPIEEKWSSDNGNRSAWKSAAFHDKDGSVGGVPGAYIVIDNGIANDNEACELKPTWNAAVCKGDYGRVSVGTPGVGGFAGSAGALTPGIGAAPAAAAPARRPAPGPGGPGGRAAGPAQPPIVLSRNGRDFTMSGEATTRSGAEIKVVTERPTVSLSLRELDKGSWVIFELPGFSTVAEGAPQDSLEALRKAKDTSYYKAKDALWVKLVSTGNGAGPLGGGLGGPALQVSR